MKMISVLSIIHLICDKVNKKYMNAYTLVFLVKISPATACWHFQKISVGEKV